MATKPTPSRAYYSFLSIARTVWKNWLWTLMVFLIVSGSTIVYVYFKVPPMFKAETLILVESQKIPEHLVASTVNAELQDRIATISQEILSATRLESLIDKFNLYRDERKNSAPEEIIDRMRKDTLIKLERGWARNQPGAFHVSYQGKDPEVVAAVVNQMGNFFIEENLKTREQQATGTAEFLKAQLEEAKKSLEQQEAQLGEYKMQHQGELPQQENSFLAVLGNLHAQQQGNQDAISRAEEKKALASTTLSNAESSLASLKSAAKVGVRMNADGKVIGAPAVEKPKDSLALQAKLDTLKARYTDSYPDVQETRALLQKALQKEAADAAAAQSSSPQTQLAAQSASGAPAPAPVAAELLTPEIRAAEERVGTLRAEVDAADKEIQDRMADRKKILSDVSTYEARLEKMPIREQEMAKLLRDYQISKNNYEQLLAKDFSADMATDMEKRQRAERFTILDPARTPEKPAKPIRQLLYGLGLVGGLVLGIATAFGREARRNVVLGEWELPPDIPVLGRVPLMEFQAPDFKTPLSEPT